MHYASFTPPLDPSALEDIRKAFAESIRKEHKVCATYEQLATLFPKRPPAEGAPVVSIDGWCKEHGFTHKHDAQAHVIVFTSAALPPRKTNPTVAVATDEQQVELQDEGCVVDLPNGQRVMWVHLDSLPAHVKEEPNMDCLPFVTGPAEGRFLIVRGPSTLNDKPADVIIVRHGDERYRYLLRPLHAPHIPGPDDLQGAYALEGSTAFDVTEGYVHMRAAHENPFRSFYYCADHLFKTMLMLGITKVEAGGRFVIAVEADKGYGTPAVMYAHPEELDRMTPPDMMQCLTQIRLVSIFLNNHYTEWLEANPQY